MQKIVIVGGGIVGLTTAFYLRKHHYEVVLIDDGVGQATKNAIGLICPWLSLRRNQKWFDLVHQGALFYQTLIKDVAMFTDKKLPYYNRGTLVIKKDFSTLSKTMQLFNKRNIEIDVTTYENTVDFIKAKHALYTKNGSSIDGDAFVVFMHKLLKDMGVKILNGKAIFENGKLYLDKELFFDKIVFACGAWLKETLKDYIVDIYPQKGQLVKLKSNRPTNFFGVMGLNGVDILPQPNSIIAVGATHEDYVTDLSIDTNKIEELISTAQQIMPELSTLSFESYHVGSRAYTKDFLPFYGEFDKNLFVACGLGSSGLTCGPIIGYRIFEMIHYQKENDDYSPLPYIKRRSK